jgi:glutamine amidotransferase
LIVIIDYGMGNLQSVKKAFSYLGHQAVVSDSADLFENASGLILPGVGSFGDAMHELETRGLVNPIQETIKAGKPFLGICLGHQLLFESSEESPGIAGLGILPGKVIRFAEGVKVPHIGWNDVRFSKPHPILRDVENGSFYYFVHSYYVVPGREDLTLMTTEYGCKFTSGIAEEKLIAFQFHPEKSSSAGLRLLENFARLCA